MKKVLKSFALSLSFLLAVSSAAISPANATVTTQTTAALAADTWVSLGAGPWILSSRSGTAQFAISDSTPSLSSTTFFIPPDSPSISIQTISNVWVKSSTSAKPAYITYAPISSGTVTISSGSVTIGAGSATIGAVTQASGPWSVSWSGQIVTANQGTANATPWNSNIAQLGGTTVSTGAGATDSGTQRVTAASDSPTVPFANPLSTASLQRGTENTGNYTANTGWNNSGAATVFTFTNACRVNGGVVLIPEVDIYSSTNPTTKLQGILWLFSSSIGTVIADNATFNIAAADFPNVTGPMQGIAFTLGSSQASGAANSAAALVGTTYEAKCAAGTTSIYGMVQVVNAYAKANGETLTIKLRTIGIN